MKWVTKCTRACPSKVCVRNWVSFFGGVTETVKVSGNWIITTNQASYLLYVQLSVIWISAHILQYKIQIYAYRPTYLSVGLSLRTLLKCREWVTKWNIMPFLILLQYILQYPESKMIWSLMSRWQYDARRQHRSWDTFEPLHHQAKKNTLSTKFLYIFPLHSLEYIVGADVQSYRYLCAETSEPCCHLST